MKHLWVGNFVEIDANGVPVASEQDENRTDGCGPHCGHWDDIQQLTRLRAAVDAYIDAEQALTRYAVLGTHKRNPDTIADLDADVDTAFHHLRKAVGR